MNFFKQEKWEDARKAHKGYSDAWIMNAIKNFKDLAEQEKVLKEALEATNNHYKIRKQLAYLYHQWSENKARENFISNHIKLAKKLFEELIEENKLKRRVSNAMDRKAFLALSNGYYGEAMHIIVQAGNLGQKIHETEFGGFFLLYPDDIRRGIAYLRSGK